jgi:hypothetical protein
MIDIAGKDRTKARIEQELLASLREQANLLGVQTTEQTDAASYFKRLITAAAELYKTGVVLIIDEYDKPILDLVNNPTERDEVHKLLGDVYGQIKNLGDQLRLVFMTGVYKFAQTSIFSNLNHFFDLTFTPLAATVVGYTQEELEANFSTEIDTLAADLGLNRAGMFTLLREQYNGYRFGVNLKNGLLSQSVYNSFAMNHVFAANDLIKKWFASGSPSFLIEQVKAGTFITIAQEGLSMDFSELDASCSPNALSAQTLLYYAGYATMAAYDPRINYVTLVYPNKEVAHAMSTQMITLFSRTDSQTALSKLIKDLALSFLDSKLDRVKEILNQALAQFSYEIMLPYEDYFQSLLFLMLQAGNLDVYPEVHTNSTRMDIVVKTPAAIYILELKFNKPAADGLNQIFEKKYFQRYLALERPIIAMGISFTLKEGAKGDEPLQNRAIADLTWIHVR